MNRRDFFKRCLGAAASMLLPAAKVVDAPKVVMDPLIATLRWESLGGMRVNFKVRRPRSFVVNRLESMRFYLAARYSRRKELRLVRDELVAMGHEVTARWIDTDFEAGSDRESGHAPPERREEFSKNDLYDVVGADCVISFTEAPKSMPSRGGRHVEFGIGLGMQKRLIVVGHRENVFHHHPNVEFFETTHAMLIHLNGFEMGR